jgi:hypothetical protein
MTGARLPASPEPTQENEALYGEAVSAVHTALLEVASAAGRCVRAAAR